MIPQSEIISWRNHAPWVGFDQVEHDLVISRALCELYESAILKKRLVFRGGTALHKLFFDKAGRFSEDLDFVQAKAEPIGGVVDAIRACLDPWLGKPSWKQSHGRFTLSYKFETEIEPVIKRKVKIEINTREHDSFAPHLEVPFSIKNRWFNGDTLVLTNSIEELLATKLRALYQRKKGRDLYDFWYAVNEFEDLDIQMIIDIFYRYISNEGLSISRAEFEQNLLQKKLSVPFNSDITPLLTREQVKKYNINDAYDILFQQFIPKLHGDPWKGLDT